MTCLDREDCAGHKSKLQGPNLKKEEPQRGDYKGGDEILDLNHSQHQLVHRHHKAPVTLHHGHPGRLVVGKGKRVSSNQEVLLGRGIGCKICNEKNQDSSMIMKLEVDECTATAQS